jgi:hypothetical protein
MSGLSVGTWDDQLDPNRLRMDIVEAFEALIVDNAIRPQKRRSLESGDSGGDVPPRKRLKIS